MDYDHHWYVVFNVLGIIVALAIFGLAYLSDQHPQAACEVAHSADVCVLELR